MTTTIEFNRTNERCLEYPTLQAALIAGYRIGDRKLTQGYISRKTNGYRDRDGDIIVYVGKGRRKGQLYYLEPNMDSTAYCWRVYLKEGY